MFNKSDNEKNALKRTLKKKRKTNRTHEIIRMENIAILLMFEVF